MCRITSGTSVTLGLHTLNETKKSIKKRKESYYNERYMYIMFPEGTFVLDGLSGYGYGYV